MRGYSETSEINSDRLLLKIKKRVTDAGVKVEEPVPSIVREPGKAHRLAANARAHLVIYGQCIVDTGGVVRPHLHFDPVRDLLSPQQSLVGFVEPAERAILEPSRNIPASIESSLANMTAYATGLAVGLSYYFSARYDDALPPLTDALVYAAKEEDVKSQGILHFYLAGAYHGKGREKQAIAELSTSIALVPHHAPAFYNRGLAHYLIGEYAAAVQDCTCAIRLEPSAQAYFVRADSHSRLGHYGKPIEDYTSAIELAPDSADAYINRGLERTVLVNYTGAMDDFKKAIGVAAQYAKPYYLLACLEVHEGHRDAALKWLRQAISRYPECREMARTDSFLVPILHDPEFRSLVGLPPE